MVLQGPAASHDHSVGWDAQQLSAADCILRQLPWELVSDLPQESLKTDVCMPILHFLSTLAEQTALPPMQANQVVQTLMKVRQLYCHVPSLPAEAL